LGNKDGETRNYNIYSISRLVNFEAVSCVFMHICIACYSCDTANCMALP